MTTAALAYLALGDSYTIGELVPAQACWPALLTQRLRASGVAIDAPEIVAVTGWSTDELMQAMDAATLTPPYALVSLQIGVNDQFRGRPADAYRAPFVALLQRAIALAGDRAERVVVVSIPDWGVTAFAREHSRDGARTADELDAYNAIARAESAAAGVAFVDITGISRAYPLLVAEDGLHPSAEQYRLWQQAIEPAAQQALAARPAHP